MEGATAEAGTAAGYGRGVIVVAHGPGLRTAERSFVISYPVEAGGHAQRIPAVVGLLEALGWSLLATRRRRTASGHANTAVLVNTARPGVEQRLWLAEPVTAPQTLGRARKLGLLPFPRAAAALKARRQAQAWINGIAIGDPGP